MELTSSQAIQAFGKVSGAFPGFFLDYGLDGGRPFCYKQIILYDTKT